MDKSRMVDELCNAWPSAVVSRTEAPKFLGGGIAVGTLANRDCIGTGVQEKYFVNGRVVYPKRALAEWFVNQMEVA